MPNYSYICLNCDHTFDETHLMKDHDKPMKKPCPKCKKKKIEKNWSLQANAVAVDSTMSPTKVMGGAWKEVMATNFAKIDQETGKVRKREDGKVLKPIGWKSPELAQFLKGK